MATVRTRARVHEAVLGLVGESGHLRLTMEGVAARAGVSKQTLYRSWPSCAAILFDALLTRSRDAAGKVAVPDSGDLAADLRRLLEETVAELTDPAVERVLRAVTAELQSDDTLPAELRARLLTPQLDAVRARLSRAGVLDLEPTGDADGVPELLYGPLTHRWLLRTAPLDEQWVAAHVQRFLRAVRFVPPARRDEPGTPGDGTAGPG